VFHHRKCFVVYMDTVPLYRVAASHRSGRDEKEDGKWKKD
jgi:hypothetical protein